LICVEREKEREKWREREKKNKIFLGKIKININCYLLIQLDRLKAEKGISSIKTYIFK